MTKQGCNAGREHRISRGQIHNCKRKYAHGYKGPELKVIPNFVGVAGCQLRAHLYPEGGFFFLMIRTRCCTEQRRK